MTLATFDRVRRVEAKARLQEWAKIRAAERQYGVQLRAVAKQVALLVRGFFGKGEEPTVDKVNQLTNQLHVYSDAIKPWATATAGRMLQDSERRNWQAWIKHSTDLSRNLVQELQGAGIGQLMRESLAKQVDLIQSLPREAAIRIQNLAISGYATGQRVGEIRNLPSQGYGPLGAVREGLAKEILRTGEVTANRANLIARTETTRVSTELTMARAEHIGSTHYIWRTARDFDVRKMHKKLEGTMHAWSDPPIAEEDGEKHHPGMFPNCRCWAEPVIPEVLH